MKDAAPSKGDLNSGRLICIVGPSGAGKDSVIDYAKANLPSGIEVRFARRTITRPSQSGGENHEAVTEEEFKRLLSCGAFVLHWSANGLSYGIRRGLHEWLAADRTVVVSGSREHLPVLRAEFPRAEVVLITAPREVLQQRLTGRGRERPEAVGKRLERSQRLGDAVPGARTILNTGALETAGEALIALLAGNRAAQSSLAREEIKFPKMESKLTEEWRRYWVSTIRS